MMPPPGGVDVGGVSALTAYDPPGPVVRTSQTRNAVETHADNDDTMLFDETPILPPALFHNDPFVLLSLNEKNGVSEALLCGLNPPHLSRSDLYTASGHYIHYFCNASSAVQAEGRNMSEKLDALRKLKKQEAEFVKFPSGNTPLSTSKNPRVFGWLWPTLFPYGVGMADNNNVRISPEIPFHQVDTLPHVPHLFHLLVDKLKILDHGNGDAWTPPVPKMPDQRESFKRRSRDEATDAAFNNFSAATPSPSQ
ncbi:hypothetical protein B0H16DRAFT_1834539 [Mycena metata]|uniref:Uncharacterized protein n=1 Tax=Mycena metata TaxID=1033252 RepID=A0AAD7J0Q3_9AGAR|nr:hypothetical protein B0H16DRAFT_1834539 [Mycena metata]